MHGSEQIGGHWLGCSGCCPGCCCGCGAGLEEVLGNGDIPLLGCDCPTLPGVLPGWGLYPGFGAG